MFVPTQTKMHHHILQHWALIGRLISILCSDWSVVDHAALWLARQLSPITAVSSQTRQWVQCWTRPGSLLVSRKYSESRLTPPLTFLHLFWDTLITRPTCWVLPVKELGIITKIRVQLSLFQPIYLSPTDVSMYSVNKNFTCRYL